MGEVIHGHYTNDIEKIRRHRSLHPKPKKPDTSSFLPTSNSSIDNISRNYDHLIKMGKLKPITSEDWNDLFKLIVAFSSTLLVISAVTSGMTILNKALNNGVSSIQKGLYAIEDYREKKIYNNIKKDIVKILSIEKRIDQMSYEELVKVSKKISIKKFKKVTQEEAAFIFIARIKMRLNNPKYDVKKTLKELPDSLVLAMLYDSLDEEYRTIRKKYNHLRNNKLYRRIYYNCISSHINNVNLLKKCSYSYQVAKGRKKLRDLYSQKQPLSKFIQTKQDTKEENNFSVPVKEFIFINKNNDKFYIDCTNEYAKLKEIKLLHKNGSITYVNKNGILTHKKFNDNEKIMISTVNKNKDYYSYETDNVYDFISSTENDRLKYVKTNDFLKSYILTKKTKQITKKNGLKQKPKKQTTSFNSSYKNNTAKVAPRKKLQHTPDKRVGRRIIYT